MSFDGPPLKLCPATLPFMKNCSLDIKNSNICDLEQLDLNMFEFQLWLMSQKTCTASIIFQLPSNLVTIHFWNLDHTNCDMEQFDFKSIEFQLWLISWKTYILFEGKVPSNRSLAVTWENWILVYLNFCNYIGRLSDLLFGSIAGSFFLHIHTIESSSIVIDMVSGAK